MKRFKTEFEYLSAVGNFFSTLHESPQKISGVVSFSSINFDEGFSLYRIAIDCYQFAHDIRESTRACREDFDIKRLSVSADYSLHRKLAKRLFKREEAYDRLSLNAPVPNSYDRRRLFWRTFYETINQSRKLITRLEAVGINQEKIHVCLHEIGEMKQAYLDYKREQVHSVAATRKKNKSFRNLQQWLIPVSDLLALPRK